MVWFLDSMPSELTAAARACLPPVSTTVVNPSLWLPIYAESPVNALFFVIFIVVCVFYLHSLTLSVVFQVFIQAASEVYTRAGAEKDECIHCAFLALSSIRPSTQTNTRQPVHRDDIKMVLRKVKPHYNSPKVRYKFDHVLPSSASC